jgi:hypothetical protein
MVSFILFVASACSEIRWLTLVLFVSAFFSSAYTSLYWSVRLFVNFCNCSVSSLLAFSILLNRVSMRSWLNSMHELSWVNSSYIAFSPYTSFDTSTLVVDAAYLSAMIMVLLSEMPLCISEQYLPYSNKVFVFFSTACAICICWVWRVIQLLVVCSSNDLILSFPAFNWSLRNVANL